MSPKRFRHKGKRCTSRRDNSTTRYVQKVATTSAVTICGKCGGPSGTASPFFFGDLALTFLASTRKLLFYVFVEITQDWKIESLGIIGTRQEWDFNKTGLDCLDQAEVRNDPWKQRVGLIAGGPHSLQSTSLGFPFNNRRTCRNWAAL